MPKPKRAVKRKLVAIAGEGAHSKPKLVQGGRFSGRIIKKADSTMSERTAREVKRNTEAYQRALKEAGIPIVPAKVKVVGYGKSKRVYFVQERVPQENILANVFSKAEPQECLRLTKELLSNIKKLTQHRKKSAYIFVMDFNFHNWVVRNGTPIFLDFYPAQIKKRGSFDSSAFLQYKSLLVKAGNLALYPRQQRKKFDPKRMVRAIIGRAIQFRPELTQNFLQLGREFAKENFSGRTLSTLLKSLEEPNNTLKPTMLGRIATAIEQKKRKKLEAKRTKKQEN